MNRNAKHHVPAPRILLDLFAFVANCVNERSFSSRSPDVRSPLPTSAAEERSQEILASIRQAFAEKGFDGASMQDLARAAGMSVGNFYRYFPSKAAIVQSMCGMDLADIQKDFTDVQGSDHPLQSLREKMLSHLSEEALKDGQLWAEVTAASIRKPEIRQVAQQMEDTITDFLAAVFARRYPAQSCRGAGTLSGPVPDADPAGEGRRDPLRPVRAAEPRTDGPGRRCGRPNSR